MLWRKQKKGGLETLADTLGRSFPEIEETAGLLGLSVGKKGKYFLEINSSGPVTVSETAVIEMLRERLEKSDREAHLTNKYRRSLDHINAAAQAAGLDIYDLSSDAILHVTIVHLRMQELARAYNLQPSQVRSFFEAKGITDFFSPTVPDALQAYSNLSAAGTAEQNVFVDASLHGDSGEEGVDSVDELVEFVDADRALQPRVRATPPSVPAAPQPPYAAGASSGAESEEHRLPFQQVTPPSSGRQDNTTAELAAIGEEAAVYSTQKREQLNAGGLVTVDDVLANLNTIDTLRSALHITDQRRKADAATLQNVLEEAEQLRYERDKLKTDYERLEGIYTSLERNVGVGNTPSAVEAKDREIGELRSQYATELTQREAKLKSLNKLLEDYNKWIAGSESTFAAQKNEIARLEESRRIMENAYQAESRVNSERVEALDVQLAAATREAASYKDQYTAVKPQLDTALQNTGQLLAQVAATNQTIAQQGLEIEDLTRMAAQYKGLVEGRGDQEDMIKRNKELAVTLGILNDELQTYKQRSPFRRWALNLGLAVTAAVGGWLYSESQHTPEEMAPAEVSSAAPQSWYDTFVSADDPDDSIEVLEEYLRAQGPVRVSSGHGTEDPCTHLIRELLQGMGGNPDQLAIDYARTTLSESICPDGLPPGAQLELRSAD